MNPTTIQVIGATLFGLAVLHTFSVKYFERLAHRYPAHSGAFHFLGEVEAVFGFWALVFVLFKFSITGKTATVDYLEGRNFTEPLFVFVIMVIAASKPIVELAGFLVRALTRIAPVKAKSKPMAFYFLVIGVVPLLGSFITEPAAMTLAALLLRDHFLSKDVSTKFKYATAGALFVNISIGGTLTAYAAPPVLMVAQTWQWDSVFMFKEFGWRAALAVAINSLAITLWFARELKHLPYQATTSARPDMPWSIIAVSLAFLIAVVVFAHYDAMFIGIFLFFLGFATAYERYQDRLILREALMVGFFLAGLVVLGAQQAWWLQPLLQKMSPDAVFFGATALTAVTDNAALTYLASLVPNLSDEFKYMVVAGAVTGGGLTVIANAPNPAGYAILKGNFPDAVIGAGGLLLAALPPTIVAIACFWGLRAIGI
jgi:Putative Na+/H+ antiporter